MFTAVINPLLSLIYPQECSVCHTNVESRSDGTACAECWDATHIFTEAEMLCGKCGAYFGEKAAPTEVFCRKCDDYFFDKALALGIYEKALAASVVSLKKSPQLPTRILKLIKARPPDINNIHLIIPIPLSRERRFERGFNQAEIIAKSVGKIVDKPVDSRSLERHLNTQIHRIGMDQKARELSVRNAFSVTRPKLITGKHILLVDDVMTSGATASQCAKALKKNGASKVTVFTLARAVMR